MTTRQGVGDGSFFIRALAANPDSQDSLNANIAICDEIHAFKQPKQYNLFKEAMKAYTNKLLIGISTADGFKFVSPPKRYKPRPVKVAPVIRLGAIPLGDTVGYPRSVKGLFF